MSLMFFDIIQVAQVCVGNMILVLKHVAMDDEFSSKLIWTQSKMAG